VSPRQPVPTHAERAAILNRILVAWDREPTLRLGQLVQAAFGWQSMPHVEDAALAERVEEFVAARERQERKRDR